MSGDHDERFDARLRRWAAKHLGVALEEVESVETKVVGGCGEGTCEYTIVDITVRLRDGAQFADREGFGMFLNEILDFDLDEDGNEETHLSMPLFELRKVDA